MASVTTPGSDTAQIVPGHYLEDAIWDHPFCAGLKASSVRLLLSSATLERYPAHQLVFSEGSEANQFYLVHKGQVALELFVPGTGVVPIQTIGEGEVCGASSMFGPYQWLFSAQTMQASELIAFAANAVRQCAQQDHEFEHDLMARLAPILFQRLKMTRQRLIEFYGAIE